MTDHITQLERLARLRSEGALSDEEFEGEKALVLSANNGRRWLFVGATLGAATLAAVVVLLLRGAERQAEPLARAPAARLAGAPGRAVPPPPPALPPLDISSRISVAGGDCHFAPDLTRAFANMLYSDGRRVRPRNVRFGTMLLTPSVSSSRDEGVDLPDFRQYESVVAFNQPVTWNGLRLLRLRAATGWEWEWEAMEFADAPAQVRAALRSMGISMPRSGNLDLPAEACGTSISLAPRGSGSALTCGGSC